MIRLTCRDNVPAWFCDMSRPVYEDDSGVVHLNNKIPDSLKVFGFFSLALPGGGVQKFRYELEKFGWNMYELIDPSLDDMSDVESICYMWVKSDVIAMQQRDLIYDFIGIAVNRHYMEIESGTDNTLQPTNLSNIITYR